jgi:hypothetical protein
VAAIAVAMLMMLWEKKAPLSEHPTDAQNEAFNFCFLRAIVCVWAVSGIMYVVLTYWWRD